MSEPTIFIQSYDGVTAQITTADGTQINPKALSLYMEAGDMHVARLEFTIVHVSAKARVEIVEFACPICEGLLQHKCPTKKGDSNYGNDEEVPF